MNILTLRPKIEVGGVRTVITNLCLGLLQQNHNAIVATTYEETPNYFGQRNIHVIPLPLYPSTLSNLLIGAARIAKFAKKERIDVIHSTHRFTTLLGKIVEKLTGIPLVVSIHELKEDKYIFSHLWISNFNIVPSKALKEHLISYYRMDLNKIRVVPNAVSHIYLIDAEHIHRLKAKVLKEEKNIAIGYIGRLSQEKGIQYLIESLDILRKNNFGVELIIIGSGPDEIFLQNYVHNLGLDAFVTFLGTRTDIPELLGMIDILVLPSISESFGSVVIEAMFASRPVIATNVGGLPEVVHNNISGYLVPPRSATSLAEAIADLVLDPDKRKSFGMSGREIALKEYTIDKMVARYLTIFQEAILAKYN